MRDVTVLNGTSVHNVASLSLLLLLLPPRLLLLLVSHVVAPLLAIQS